MTITEILSTEPLAMANFNRLRAISSGYNCVFNIVCISLILAKSQSPSLATTINRWFRRIYIFFTYGLTISPMFFFRDRSPKALVIAKRPPNLPIIIFPPACLYVYAKLLHSGNFLLVITTMLIS